VGLDRGGFACVLGGKDRRTLYIAAAEYGPDSFAPGAPRTGQIISVEAPAPGVGWP
jgi:sugar lactone lactonase YvrE